MLLNLAHTMLRLGRGLACVSLCIIMLVVRLSGMHTHLCFDGLKSVTSIEWAATDIADDFEHAAKGHAPCDSCLANEVAANSGTAHLDHPPVLPISLVLMAAFYIVVSAIAPTLATKLIPTRELFLPPLRAPPR